MEPASLDQSLTQALASYAQPVVAAYGLGCLVYGVFRRRGDFRSTSAAARERRFAYSAAASSLSLYGLLTGIRGVREGSAFRVLGRKTSGPGEIACTIDPFAYVSHLSAMELYGFTDRVSRMLYLSSPDPKAWGQFAGQRMLHDLGDDLEDYLARGYPSLQRTNFRSLDGFSVRMTKRSHLGAFRKAGETELRVATIGRTFLDMLREPDDCGGIQHVLSAYEQHAASHLELIVAEIERHGGPIDKVRGGYVLEEHCHLSHALFERWHAFVARGGSRKLVANREYAPVYSERWAISLNVL
jgi:predicted transcriptional regulator of viral defense system